MRPTVGQHKVVRFTEWTGSGDAGEHYSDPGDGLGRDEPLAVPARLVVHYLRAADGHVQHRGSVRQRKVTTASRYCGKKIETCSETQVTHLAQRQRFALCQ